MPHFDFENILSSCCRERERESTRFCVCNSKTKNNRATTNFKKLSKTLKFESSKPFKCGNPQVLIFSVKNKSSIKYFLNRVPSYCKSRSGALIGATSILLNESKIVRGGHINIEPQGPTCIENELDATWHEKQRWTSGQDKTPPESERESSLWPAIAPRGTRGKFEIVFESVSNECQMKYR